MFVSLERGASAAARVARKRAGDCVGFRAFGGSITSSRHRQPPYGPMRPVFGAIGVVVRGRSTSRRSLTREKGEHMQRRETSWRFGVLAPSSCSPSPRSAPVGAVRPRRASLSPACSSAARPTRSRTSIRRATTTSGRSRSGSTCSSISTTRRTAPRSCRRSPRVAPTRQYPYVALHAPAWRHVPRRLGVRLRGREVLVRQGLAQVIKEAAANTPSSAALQPPERADQRALRRDVQPQGAAVDVAVHPHDRCCRDRPGSVYPANHLQKNNQPQIGTGPTGSRATRRASRRSSSRTTTTGARRRGTTASSSATTRSRRR